MNNDIVITNNTPEEISIIENENQTITISSGGNVIGIIDVKVNGNSVVVGNTAYVIVPTKTSQLINDSGFITEETDPTVPSVVKNITLADINNWNSKQNTLVSGTNIKTINNNSLLGSGNLTVEGVLYTAGDGIEINENVINNTITSYEDLSDLPEIPSKTSDLLNDNNFVSENELSEVAFDGSYTSLSNTPTIPDSTSQLVNDSNYVTGSEVSTEIQTAISTKQDTLVSGTNIKTINNTSLLGGGDMQINNFSAGTGIDITSNVITNTLPSLNNSFAGTQTFNNVNITGTAKINNYSTTEQEIGTWTDGKTLYRKVVEYNTALTSGSNIISHNISNMDKIIKVTGFVPLGNTRYFFGAYENNNTFVTVNYANRSEVGVNVGSGWGSSFGNGCILILEYTKL